MPKGSVNLQDFFLNFLRRQGVEVQLGLVNGVEVRGVVKGFDSFTVVVEEQGRPHLVYKHAIAQLTPLGPVPDLCTQALRHWREQQAEEENDSTG